MTWLCTRRERNQCLWSSLVAITFVACSLLLFISVHYTGYDYKRKTSATDSLKAEKLTDEKCAQTCFTKECILQASLLNNLMNPNADVCEDFYSFSCGKYMENAGKDDNVSTFEDFGLRLQIELKDLLDNLEAGPPDSASGKMKVVYDSCMDVRSSELEALPSVYEFLEKVGIRSWPNLPTDFRFSEPSLPKALGILAGYCEFSFLQFLNPNSDEKQNYSSSIGPSLAGKRSSFSENVFVSAMEYVAGEGKLKEMMESFAEYEPFFKWESTEHCEWENATGVHIDCSQEVEPNWVMLCQMLDTFVDVANVNEIISKHHISIPCGRVPLVKRALQVLNKVPHRFMADFLGFHLLASHLDDLNFPLRLILQGDQVNMMDDLFYEPLPLPHWQHCLHWITKNMPLALGHEYTKNVITEPALREADRIMKEGFQEAAKLIFEQNWLDDEKKSFILHKLDKQLSTGLQIRYYLNETFVNEYYKQFHPTDGSFMRNVLERQRSLFTTDMIHKWKDPVLHQLEPFSVNAWDRKKITELALGNFRFPTFMPEDSRFLNGVRLAGVVGHEIGHIINDAIDELEINGTSAGEYIQEIISCFEKQFSNFTIESLERKVDPELTAPENYADSISIILTDRFIEKYIGTADPYVLPSLPYTTKQLIYIMHSEMMCTKLSKERESARHSEDSHALDRFRFTAMMQNSEGFAKAYNCSERSYMNPSTKCLYLDEK